MKYTEINFYRWLYAGQFKLWYLFPSCSVTNTVQGYEYTKTITFRFAYWALSIFKNTRANLDLNRHDAHNANVIGFLK